MLALIATALIVLALAFASGCARTVLVQEGSPIKLARPVQARVMYLTQEGWREAQTDVEIPEGWWIVSPQFVDGNAGEP
jgi:hypothetical protein